MLIIEDIEVSWSGSNRKHFESLGYIYTKRGDTFTVFSNELSKGSHTKVRVLCDYCKEEMMIRSFKTHTNQKENDIIDKDCCVKCRPLKVSESNLLTYGTEWITQTDEFKEKSKATNLTRYGMEYYQSTEEFQEKTKATHMKRYGVEYTMQNEEFLLKREKTSLKKYGVPNPMQSEKVKQKLINALHKNGTAPSSSQQRHIHTLIGGKLNYPQDAVMLDIAFPDEKVYLEYDGSGHELQVKFGAITQEEFEKQERKRSYFLYRKGWKEIRIISDDDKLPVDSAIKDFANRARSFFNAKNPPFSIHWNLNTGVVVINHKMNSSIEDFLLEDFPLEEKEVS